MLGRTHLVIASLVGVVLAPFVWPDQPWMFIALVSLGGLLPDVDHEKSKINKWVPVTRIVPLFFRHRGFFHSVFPMLFIGGGLWYADFPFQGLAVAIGYASHLLSDCCTREGCNLLHPISTFRVQGPFTTGTIIETMLFLAVSGLLGAVVLVRIGLF